MKRLISAVLVSLMLLSGVACGRTVPDTANSVTASAGTEKYVTLFEERTETMPDSLVLATGEDATAYGVDVSAFVDDEGYTVRANDGDVVILAKTAAGIDRGVRHITAYGNYENYTFTYGEDYRVRNLTVMGKPIEDFAIVRPDDADASMCYATEELVKYVRLATGVTLPIYSKGDYTADGNKIELIIDYPGHDDEAFSVDVKENGDIDILCGRYRGGLYGVYGLLEDIGWRYLADGTEYVYETDSLNLTEDLDRREEGAIPNRFSASFTCHKYPLANGVRINAHYNIGGDVKYGLYGITQPACHGLLAVTDLRGADRNGEQPCFTNEDGLDGIEEYFRGQIEARLAAGAVVGRDFNFIDVSQFDTMPTGFCMCTECMRVLGEEGSHAGAVLRMTNRMADMAAEYDPNLGVLMLAYCGTNKPPRVTVPRENVKIAYCFYIGADNGNICTNHKITDENCIRNATYYNEYEGWKKICAPNSLQAWYYPFNAYEIACHVYCFDTAFADMKYLIESGTNCVMLCDEYLGDPKVECIWLTILNELMWDGDMTEEEYLAKVEEYYSIYYGKGGKYVLEYTNTLLKAGDLMGCWTNFDNNARDMFSYGYMANNFDYMMRLFDIALKYAESEAQQNRIEIMKAQMMYVCINATHESDYVNGTAEQRALFEERYTEMHGLYKKHSIVVYDALPLVYVPNEIDFSRKPEDHWSEGITRG